MPENIQEISDDFTEMIDPYLPKGTDIETFLKACISPLKKSITINTDKISVKKFKEITKPRGRHLTPHKFTENPISFYIDRDNTDIALGNTFLYKCGFFYIQEVAASLPALLIDSKDGDIILDMCASPGGKASQLAKQLLQNGKGKGIIVANDVASSRVKTLAHNINLQGSYNTAITQFNGFMFGKHLPNFFDHILVDAPCSGEGTGFKSDHALKYRRKEEVNKIAGTQFQLLVSAIKSTKVGGSVVYSTCTLNPYENEAILARVLEFFQGSIQLEKTTFLNADKGLEGQFDEYTFKQGDTVQRFWPNRQGTGGFFVSKIRKIADHTKSQQPKKHKLLPKNQFKITMHKKLQKQVTQYAKQNFGVTIDHDRYLFVSTKNKVYVTSPTFKAIQPEIDCEKIGVPVFKVDRRHNFRPTHYFGLIFGHLANKNVVQFSNEDMQLYVNGKNVPTSYKKDHEEIPYKVIQRGENNWGMGVTKFVKGVWKNKYGK